MHISPVQEYALQLLMLIENNERKEDFSQQVRLALLSYDPERYLATFGPEALKKAKAIPLAADDDLEDTEGEWVFENPVAPEDAMKILEEMLGDTSGEMQAAEIEREWL